MMGGAGVVCDGWGRCGVWCVMGRHDLMKT